MSSGDSSSSGHVECDGVTFSAASFEAAEERVKGALGKQKIGVLWRLDANAVFKMKLEKEIPKNVIVMGVCNPAIGFDVLSADPSCAIHMPCQAYLTEGEEGKFHFSVTDPLKTFGEHRPEGDPRREKLQAAAASAHSIVTAALEELKE